MMPRRRSMFDQVDPETGLPIMDGQGLEAPPAPDFQSEYMMDPERQQEQPQGPGVVDAFMQAQQPQEQQMPQDELMMGPNAALEGAEGAGYEREAMDADQHAQDTFARNSKIKGLGMIASGFLGGDAPLDTSGIDEQTQYAHYRANEAKDALARYQQAQGQREEQEYARGRDKVGDAQAQQEAAYKQSQDAQAQANADRQFNAGQQAHADSLKENSRNRNLQRELADEKASRDGAQQVAGQTLEDVKKHTASVESSKNVLAALDRLRALNDKAGGLGNNVKAMVAGNMREGNTLMGSDKNAIDSEIAMIQADLKTQLNTGTWDKGSAELLGNIAGLNMTGMKSLLNSKGVNARAIDELENKIRTRLESSGEVRGFAGEKNLPEQRQEIGQRPAPAAATQPAAPAKKPRWDPELHAWVID